MILLYLLKSSTQHIFTSSNSKTKAPIKTQHLRQEDNPTGQVANKAHSKDEFFCPRINFFNISALFWWHTNPGSWKTESFLGGMARPRSYREATPIACDGSFTLELWLGRSIFKCCWDIDIRLSKFKWENTRLSLHIYKESFEVFFYLKKLSTKIFLPIWYIAL